MRAASSAVQVKNMLRGGVEYSFPVLVPVHQCIAVGSHKLPNVLPSSLGPAALKLRLSHGSAKYHKDLWAALLFSQSFMFCTVL